MLTAKTIQSTLNKGAGIALITLLLAVVAISVSARAPFHDSVGDFVGEWHYTIDSYDMSITINSLPSGGHNAYYSIAAQSGQRLDVGDEDNLNVEIVRYNTRTRLLELKLTSSYSTAQYHATLKKVSANQVEFKLGERIASGIHFYPRKPLMLTKR